MVEQLYGKRYRLHTLYVEPGDLGHTGAARRRLYIIMAHRKTIVQIYDCKKLYGKIADTMRGMVGTQPRDYLVATPVDVRLEAERVALLRKVPLRPLATCLQTCSCFFGSLNPDCSLPWSRQIRRVNGLDAMCHLTCCSDVGCDCLLQCWGRVRLRRRLKREMLLQSFHVACLVFYGCLVPRKEIFRIS